MYIVIKGFSGQVSGRKDEIIELKDKAVIKELLRAGYIAEYSSKNQSNSELKKEIDALKKTIASLETEKEELKVLLDEANKKIEEKEANNLESGNNNQDNEQKTNE